MTLREAELSAALAASQQENARLRQEVVLLQQKIDALVRRIFGSKSEQLNPAQLELLLTGNEDLLPPPPPGKGDASPAASTAGDTLEASPADHTLRPAKPARRPRLPEHLPIVEELIDPPEVLADPGAFRRIGEERTAQLDYTPGRFVQRHTVRGKYVRKGDPEAPPVIAPLTILQDRCLAAPALLAHIIVAKYCDHLPLYRLEQIFKTRHNVLLPRQTMVRWLAMAAFWLSGLCRQITRAVLDGGYVQIDETAIKYLDPGHGKTRTGYLWTMHRPGTGTVFHWSTTRSADTLEKLIPQGWKGTIQCDGYSAYDAFAAKRQGDITLVSCMAHIRRDLFEAKEEAPVRAGWLLRQIQNLYQIEKRLREQRAGPKLRAAVRRAQAAPIMDRIKKALLLYKTRGRHLPRGAFGKALHYALGQWSAMEVYLTDGRIEIDNNLTENAIRPTALGKKNWLFIGDADAGETSATLYTVIENARRLGIDPEAYLTDLLTLLPTLKQNQLVHHTPGAWAKARKTRPAAA